MTYRVSTKMWWAPRQAATQWCKDNSITARLEVPVGQDFVYIWCFDNQEDAVQFTLAWADYLVYE